MDDGGPPPVIAEASNPSPMTFKAFYDLIRAGFQHSPHSPDDAFRFWGFAIISRCRRQINCWHMCRDTFRPLEVTTRWLSSPWSFERDPGMGAVASESATRTLSASDQAKSFDH